MFKHRRKTIGKSVYSISSYGGRYVIEEVYNHSEVAKSNYSHYNIDDAIEELRLIDCERFYTDRTRGVCRYV